jgi:tripartite-type tricarboxylate transporter receptor subunit TctC
VLNRFRRFRTKEKRKVALSGITLRIALLRNPGLALAMGLALGMVALQPASAQDYPTRTVRLLIGFPAGGATAFVAGLMAPKYSASLKQPVMVESRPGADGTVATALTAKAAPDGHTLHLATIGSLVITPAIAKVSYDPLRDLAPVSQVVSMPNVFIVAAGSPAAKLSDLITLAKQNPRGLTYATADNGMPGRLAGELFKTMAKVDLLEAKYKNRGAAVNDLAAGHISLLVAATSTAVPQVKSGKARALAVTGNKRISALPDVPTAEESGLGGYEATNWYGVVVPAGTPQRIIDRLHKETATILSTPDIAKALNARGIEVAPSLPEQFFAYIRSETTKWAKVIHAINAGNAAEKNAALNP